MGSNIIELAKLGHERAAELKASCGAVNVRSLAQLISDLATQLEVQLVRGNAQAVQLANAESKCRELAAENGVIKAMNDCLSEELRGYESDGAFEGPKMHLLWWKVETPATDAFLAEVRAQVWIEGSEPAEFGRYWVRYETDVGPQYCSAKWIEHNFCVGSNTNIHKIWLADHSRSINSLKGVTHYTMLPESIEGGAK
ncbi:hypothetical protein ACFJP4_003380 [Salmonella enterica]